MPIRDKAPGYEAPPSELEKRLQRRIITVTGEEFDLGRVEAMLRDGALIEDEDGRIYRRYRKGESIHNEALPIMRRGRDGSLIAYRYDDIAQPETFARIAQSPLSTPEEAESVFGQFGQAERFLRGVYDSTIGAVSDIIRNREGEEHTSVVDAFNPFVSRQVEKKLRDGRTLIEGKGGVETTGEITGGIGTALLGGAAGSALKLGAGGIAALAGAAPTALEEGRQLVTGEEEVIPALAKTGISALTAGVGGRLVSSQTARFITERAAGRALSDLENRFVTDAVLGFLENAGAKRLLTIAGISAASNLADIAGRTGVDVLQGREVQLDSSTLLTAGAGALIGGVVDAGQALGAGRAMTSLNPGLAEADILAFSEPSVDQSPLATAFVETKGGLNNKYYNYLTKDGDTSRGGAIEARLVDLYRATTGTDELPHIGVAREDGTNDVSIDTEGTFDTLRELLAGATPLPHVTPENPVLPVREALHSGRLGESFPFIPENLAPDIARLELQALVQKTAGLLGADGLNIVAQNLGLKNPSLDSISAKLDSLSGTDGRPAGGAELVGTILGYRPMEQLQQEVARLIQRQYTGEVLGKRTTFTDWLNDPAQRGVAVTRPDQIAALAAYAERYRTAYPDNTVRMQELLDSLSIVERHYQEALARSDSSAIADSVGVREDIEAQIEELNSELHLSQDELKRRLKNAASRIVREEKSAEKVMQSQMKEREAQAAAQHQAEHRKQETEAKLITMLRRQNVDPLDTYRRVLQEVERYEERNAGGTLFGEIVTDPRAHARRIMEMSKNDADLLGHFISENRAGLIDLLGRARQGDVDAAGDLVEIERSLGLASNELVKRLESKPTSREYDNAVVTSSHQTETGATADHQEDTNAKTRSAETATTDNPASLFKSTKKAAMGISRALRQHPAQKYTLLTQHGTFTTGEFEITQKGEFVADGRIVKPSTILEIRDQDGGVVYAARQKKSISGESTTDDVAGSSVPDNTTTDDKPRIIAPEETLRSITMFRDVDSALKTVDIDTNSAELPDTPSANELYRLFGQIDKILDEWDGTRESAARIGGTVTYKGATYTLGPSTLDGEEVNTLTAFLRAFARHDTAHDMSLYSEKALRFAGVEDNPVLEAPQDVVETIGTSSDDDGPGGTSEEGRMSIDPALRGENKRNVGLTDDEFREKMVGADPKKSWIARMLKDLGGFEVAPPQGLSYDYRNEANRRAWYDAIVGRGFFENPDLKAWLDSTYDRAGGALTPRFTVQKPGNSENARLGLADYMSELIKAHALGAGAGTGRAIDPASRAETTNTIMHLMTAVREMAGGPFRMFAALSRKKTGESAWRTITDVEHLDASHVRAIRVDMSPDEFLDTVRDAETEGLLDNADPEALDSVIRNVDEQAKRGFTHTFLSIVDPVSIGASALLGGAIGGAVSDEQRGRQMGFTGELAALFGTAALAYGLSRRARWLPRVKMRAKHVIANAKGDVITTLGDNAEPLQIMDRYDYVPQKGDVDVSRREEVRNMVRLEHDRLTPEEEAREVERRIRLGEQKYGSFEKYRSNLIGIRYGLNQLQHPEAQKIAFAFERGKREGLFHEQRVRDLARELERALPEERSRNVLALVAEHIDEVTTRIRNMDNLTDAQQDLRVKHFTSESYIRSRLADASGKLGSRVGVDQLFAAYRIMRQVYDTSYQAAYYGKISRSLGVVPQEGQTLEEAIRTRRETASTTLDETNALRTELFAERRRIRHELGQTGDRAKRQPLRERLRAVQKESDRLMEEARRLKNEINTIDYTLETARRMQHDHAVERWTHDPDTMPFSVRVENTSTGAVSRTFTSSSQEADAWLMAELRSIGAQQDKSGVWRSARGHELRIERMKTDPGVLYSSRRAEAESILVQAINRQSEINLRRDATAWLERHAEKSVSQDGEVSYRARDGWEALTNYFVEIYKGKSSLPPVSRLLQDLTVPPAVRSRRRMDAQGYKAPDREKYKWLMSGLMLTARQGRTAIQNGYAAKEVLAQIDDMRSLGMGDAHHPYYEFLRDTLADMHAYREYAAADPINKVISTVFSPMAGLALAGKFITGLRNFVSGNVTTLPGLIESAAQRGLSAGTALGAFARGQATAVRDVVSGRTPPFLSAQMGGATQLSGKPAEQAMAQLRASGVLGDTSVGAFADDGSTGSGIISRLLLFTRAAERVNRTVAGAAMIELALKTGATIDGAVADAHRFISRTQGSYDFLLRSSVEQKLMARVPGGRGLLLLTSPAINANFYFDALLQSALRGGSDGVRRVMPLAAHTLLLMAFGGTAAIPYLSDMLALSDVYNEATARRRDRDTGEDLARRAGRLVREYWRSRGVREEAITEYTDIATDIGNGIVSAALDVNLAYDQSWLSLLDSFIAGSAEKTARNLLTLVDGEIGAALEQQLRATVPIAATVKQGVENLSRGYPVTREGMPAGRPGSYTVSNLVRDVVLGTPQSRAEQSEQEYQSARLNWHNFATEGGRRQAWRSLVSHAEGLQFEQDRSTLDNPRLYGYARPVHDAVLAEWQSPQLAQSIERSLELLDEYLTPERKAALQTQALDAIDPSEAGRAPDRLMNQWRDYVRRYYESYAKYRAIQQMLPMLSPTLTFDDTELPDGRTVGELPLPVRGFAYALSRIVATDR